MRRSCQTTTTQPAGLRMRRNSRPASSTLNQWKAWPAVMKSTDCGGSAVASAEPLMLEKFRLPSRKCSLAARISSLGSTPKTRFPLSRKSLVSRPVPEPISAMVRSGRRSHSARKRSSKADGRGPRSSRKLAEEAHVALKKELNIVDAVFQHGEAVDAEAEGKAADFFRVVVDEAVDRRVDHARAKELDPSRALALAAHAAGLGVAGAAAKDARSVEFDRRLRERKIAWTETRFHVFAEELSDEVVNRSGEIAKSDVLVDGQAFDLMEHEGVRGVGIIAPVNLAWDDDAHGRLALLHGANLHGRRVGAE